jgi:hypothetical protein
MSANDPKRTLSTLHVAHETVEGPLVRRRCGQAVIEANGSLTQQQARLNLILALPVALLMMMADPWERSPCQTLISLYELRLASGWPRQPALVN